MNNLVWIDLEMTGLNHNIDHILEFAIVITNYQLDIIDQQEFVIFQSQAILDQMDDWNKNTHTTSGLIDKVIHSTCRIEEAEQLGLQFISQYTAWQTSPLCGNSVHQDRKFLAKYTPKIDQYLHYRNIDVSTLKELARIWYPSMAKYHKQNQHKALNDIYESIKELHYYRKFLLIKS